MKSDRWKLWTSLMSLMMDRCERSRHVIPNDGRTVRFDGTGGFVRDGWWRVSWDLAEREKLVESGERRDGRSIFTARGLDGGRKEEVLT